MYLFVAVLTYSVVKLMKSQQTKVTQGRGFLQCHSRRHSHILPGNMLMEKRGVDTWTSSLSRAVVTDRTGDVGVLVATRSQDCIVQQGVVLSYFVSETKNTELQTDVVTLSFIFRDP